jgi:hypothetical protein
MPARAGMPTLAEMLARKIRDNKDANSSKKFDNTKIDSNSKTLATARSQGTAGTPSKERN